MYKRQAIDSSKAEKHILDDEKEARSYFDQLWAEVMEDVYKRQNEWYARDTSKKIKSTFKAKGKSGKHVASTTPYGYLKDKDDPNIWIVDEEAAAVVRRIFHMTMDGYGPYQIARALKEDKVEIPAVHMAKKDAGLWKGRVEEIKDPYGWGSSTVAGILKKREYLGHTVNFKTRKHFKDKKSHYVSEDNWTVFENTQEAIIAVSYTHLTSSKRW